MKNTKSLKNTWIKEKANYVDDTLYIKGYQVMQDWEKPYMKDLADVATSNGGHILEFGFGLGISAGYIQKSKLIRRHTIIEAHPDVINYATKKFRNELKSGRMNILQGFWEDITPMLKDNYFDGVLFDTSPLGQETEFFHYFPCFDEVYRVLKPGGVFSYFSDEPKEISQKHLELLKKTGFRKINYRVCKINPPRKCNYWKQKTIITPVVHK